MKLGVLQVETMTVLVQVVVVREVVVERRAYTSKPLYGPALRDTLWRLPPPPDLASVLSSPEVLVSSNVLGLAAVQG